MHLDSNLFHLALGLTKVPLPELLNHLLKVLWLALEGFQEIREVPRMPLAGVQWLLHGEPREGSDGGCV